MSELPVEELDYRDRLSVIDNNAEKGKIRTQDIELHAGCRVIDLYSYLFHEIPAGATVSLITISDIRPGYPDGERLRLTWRPQ